MGIKSLNTFITTNANNSILDTKISSLEGKRIAIDTSIFAYKFMYSGKFIENFIQQVSHFAKHNISPIYVFDGAPPKEKQETLNSRKENKEKLCLKITELQAEINTKKQLKEDVKSLVFKLADIKRKCITITRDDIMNLKNVFNILGVSYIQADCEADLVCCELYKRSIVQACMSNDMDFLPSGCGMLVRNYNLSDNVTLYDLNVLLNQLELNYDQFVDFCILCGCDYTGKISRLGTATAYKLIKLDNNIETILEKYCGEGKKYKFPTNFEFQKARTILKNENQNKNVNLDIRNNTNHKKTFTEISSQVSYIKSLTKYTDKQLENRLQNICSV